MAAPALSIHVAHKAAQRNGRRRPAVAPRCSALSFSVGWRGAIHGGAHFFSGANGIDQRSRACLRTGHVLGLRLAPWSSPAVDAHVGSTSWRPSLPARRWWASPRPLTCAGSVGPSCWPPSSKRAGEASAGDASHLLRHPGAGEPSLGRRFLGPGCGLAAHVEHPPDGPGGRRLLATWRPPHRPQSGSPDEGVMAVTLMALRSLRGLPEALSGAAGEGSGRPFPGRSLR